MISVPDDCRFVLHDETPVGRSVAARDALAIIQDALAAYDAGVSYSLIRMDESEGGGETRLLLKAKLTPFREVDVKIDHVPPGTTLREGAEVASRCLLALADSDEGPPCRYDPLDLALAVAEIARTVPGMQRGCGLAPMPWRALRAFSRDADGRPYDCPAVDEIAGGTGRLVPVLGVNYSGGGATPFLRISCVSAHSPELVSERLDPIALMRAMAALEDLRSSR